jgi:imidazolonepropionase-like amidohydrolase
MPSLMSPLLSMTAAAATLLAAATGASAQRSHVHGTPPEAIAFTGGRVITVAGEDIPQGTIVVRSGVIVAVGPADQVELPYDAIEVELEPGMVVMPGMINPAANDGLAGPNESYPITPFLDIRDAIDPASLFFEAMLRSGVTSVHVMPTDNAVLGGMSAVVRPIGLTMADMDLKGEMALKFTVGSTRSNDRMTQLAQHREIFASHADYVQNLAEQRYEKSRKDENKPVDVPPAEARRRGMEMLEDSDYDERNRNIMRLLRGDLHAWFVCPRAMDVSAAIGLANDNKLADRSVLILGAEAYKAAGTIAAAGLPVVLNDSLFYRQRDVLTGEINEVFVPKALADKGIKFALVPNADGSFAERYPTYLVAQCIRQGVPRDVAFKAVTQHPAEMLGLGDQLGTIEVGKIANLVILSGDPLDFRSEVAHVYIEGIHAYDRSKDQRLQEVLKLTEGFAARAAEQAAEKAAEKKAPAKEGAKDASAPAGRPASQPASPDAERPREGQPGRRPGGDGPRPERQRRGN